MDSYGDLEMFTCPTLVTRRKKSLYISLSSSKLYVSLTLLKSNELANDAIVIERNLVLTIRAECSIGCVIVSPLLCS